MCAKHYNDHRNYRCRDGEFHGFSKFMSGDAVFTLPIISSNGVVGSWAPTSVNPSTMPPW
ncbi:MAG: hypothetical protein IPL35_04795 [Sphingobacteriales bacterium]|nr:hypothetical protein [Sphingobacteriales bacterium]